MTSKLGGKLRNLLSASCLNYTVFFSCSEYALLLRETTTYSEFFWDLWNCWCIGTQIGNLEVLDRWRILLKIEIRNWLCPLFDQSVISVEVVTGFTSQ